MFFFSSTVNKIQRVSSLRNFRLCVVSEERDYQVFIDMNKAGIQMVYKLKLEEKAEMRMSFKNPTSCTVCTGHAVWEMLAFRVPARYAG